MQNAALAGMNLLRGLYPVHKSGGLQAAAGANTTVMPAKRQKSASNAIALPSARAPTEPGLCCLICFLSEPLPPVEIFDYQFSAFRFPPPSFPQSDPANYRNGNFENNFPLLNNIIWELVFFTLLWYHFCLCSEKIYFALYYLLADSGV